MIVIVESLLDESDLKKYEDHVNNLHSEKEKRFILLRKFNENLSSRFVNKDNCKAFLPGINIFKKI